MTPRKSVQEMLDDAMRKVGLVAHRLPRVKPKTTAELMREADERRGLRPIVIGGQSVEPARARRPKTGRSSSGNGSKK